MKTLHSLCVLLAVSLFAGGCHRDELTICEPAGEPVKPEPEGTKESMMFGMPLWPLPAGWKRETILFPLEFAPEIHHRGVEELRFMPGMFKPGAPDHWSYGFAWWVEERELQSPESLGGELQAYFRGLLGSAGKEKGLTVDPAKITLALHPLRMKDVDGWRPMIGEAAIVDAFGDGKPVNLSLWVYQREYPAQARRAVLVLASPAPAASPVWTALNGLKDSFPR